MVYITYISMVMTGGWFYDILGSPQYLKIFFHRQPPGIWHSDFTEKIWRIRYHQIQYAWIHALGTSFERILYQQWQLLLLGRSDPELVGIRKSMGSNNHGDFARFSSPAERPWEGLTVPSGIP
jgi:hypothetical protein